MHLIELLKKIPIAFPLVVSILEGLPLEVNLPLIYFKETYWIEQRKDIHHIIGTTFNMCPHI
jgi:hypothetical protein